MLEFFGFDFMPLVMGLVGGIISAGAMGWKALEKYVKKTPATWDDALLDALASGIKDRVNKPDPS